MANPLPTVTVGAGLEIALQLDDAGVRKHFGIAGMVRLRRQLVLTMTCLDDLRRLRSACQNEAGNHPEAAYRRSCAAAIHAIDKVLAEKLPDLTALANSGPVCDWCKANGVTNCRHLGM